VDQLPNESEEMTRSEINEVGKRRSEGKHLGGFYGSAGNRNAEKSAGNRNAFSAQNRLKRCRAGYIKDTIRYELLFAFEKTSLADCRYIEAEDRS